MLQKVIIMIGIVTGLVLLKHLILFLITKKFSLSRKNIIIAIVEILIASIFFSMIISIPSTNTSHLIILIFLVIICTYNYSIVPITYLFIYKKNQTATNIEQKLLDKGFKYKVRVIELEKPNAFATGVLPFYKLIFVDKKILETLPEEQAMSIILHEVGHHELHHLKKLLLINILIFILGAYVLRTINIDNFYYVSIFIFSFAFIFAISITRTQYIFEYQADSFSAKINTQKNMVEALQNLDPIFNGRVSKGGVAHPTLAKRIEHINNEK